MKRFAILLCAAMVLPAYGCQRDDKALKEKLDGIDKKLTSLEEAIKKMPKGRAAGQKRPQRPRPNPGDTYSVNVDGSPMTGPADAKVTIVKAFEFACPFCKRVRPTLDQLQKDYGKDVRVVYKHFVVHPGSATTPALAACAAGNQGKYKQMEELIWTKGFDAGRNLSRENMEKLAGEAGVDLAKFKADMDGACKAKIRKDQSELQKVGVSGTPAFFINGRFLSGARPIDQFKKLVDEELVKANKRISEGTPANNYYSEWVVKKGKKKL